MSNESGQRVMYVLNGPNLGRLGSREPAIYGHDSYADLVARCETAAREAGWGVIVRQSESEGELIEWLHEAASRQAPVALNAAAYTHYSYAIADACLIVADQAPVIEVHLSNPGAREEFRRHSVLTPVVRGVISGFGLLSYELAIRALAELAS